MEAIASTGTDGHERALVDQVHERTGTSATGHTDRRIRRRAARFAAGLVCCAAALLTAAPLAPAQTPPDTLVPIQPPSVFVPVTPVRVFSNVLYQSPSNPFETVVALAGQVPENATAVVVNITALSQIPGYPAGVYACGLRVRTTCKSPFSTFDSSASNVRSASDLATLAVGADRTLLIGGPPNTTVVGDLLGYYLPAGATPTAGRFKPVSPVRVFDSRDGAGALDAGAVTIDLTSRLPADAAAAVVTLTVVDRQRDGYVTAFATGSAPPYISNLLVLAPQQTISNQAVVQLQNRSMTVLQTGRSDLLVDLAGYYTSNAAAAGTDGLFVPTLDTELYNSFQNIGLPSDPYSWVPPQPEAAGSTVTAAFTQPIFGPPIAALLLRVDAQLETPGFVNVWGAGTQPWTTDLFVDTPSGGHTSTVTTGLDGRALHLFLSARGWLRVEANGYFTAAM
ncbi:MAG: hypothetical protein AB7W59_29090 [Acidimicrobiia bacterium]